MKNYVYLPVSGAGIEDILSGNETQHLVKTDDVLAELVRLAGLEWSPGTDGRIVRKDK